MADNYENDYEDFAQYEEREDCDVCWGEGFIEYADHPEVWGEDCPSLVNHLQTCYACGGCGFIRTGESEATP